MFQKDLIISKCINSFKWHNFMCQWYMLMKHTCLKYLRFLTWLWIIPSAQHTKWNQLLKLYKNYIIQLKMMQTLLKGLLNNVLCFCKLYQRLLRNICFILMMKGSKIKILLCNQWKFMIKVEIYLPYYLIVLNQVH